MQLDVGTIYSIIKKILLINLDYNPIEYTMLFIYNINDTSLI